MTVSPNNRSATPAPWRAAIVTGASAGIGEALAGELARRNVSVGLLARREDRLRELARRLSEIAPGARFPFRAADVADAGALPEALDALWAELDGADLFIANAGVGRSTPATSAENLPALREVLAVNVTGTLVGIEHVKNRMLEQGHGHLAGISSLADARGFPGSTAYGASKAALTTYLEALAVALPPRGIRVTIVRPGYIRTEMTRSSGSLPFLLEVDAAARIILRGLERGRCEIAFPIPTAVLIGLLRRVPLSLYLRIARRFLSR